MWREPLILEDVLRALCVFFSLAFLLVSVAEAGASVCVEGPSGSLVHLMSGGSFHSCAIDAEGDPYCWGRDGSGQLGDGGVSVDRDVPGPVDTSGIGGKSFVMLEAGRQHTCGLTTDGDIYCWGDNYYGVLGDGGGSVGSQLPVAVDTTPITGNKSFVQVVCGYYHTCGLTAEGVAYCWGYDAMGQLGDANAPIEDCFGENCSRLPIVVDTSPISGKKPFVRLTAGRYHTCGVTGEGVAYCWGMDTYGQLGDGNQLLDICGLESCSHVPVAVDTLPITGEKSIVHIDAGHDHTCASTGEGASYCWGRDTHGQLGDGGGSTDSQSPVPVSGGGGFVQLVAGGEYTCGLTAAGGVYCWGSDTYGQLGNATGAPDDCSGNPCSQSPFLVDILPVTGEQAVVHLGLGGYHVCGITGEGDTYCWGKDDYGQLGDGIGASDDCGGALCSESPSAIDTLPIITDKTYVQIAAGPNHSCGVTSNGEAYCWGADTHGNLGDGGSSIDTQSAVAVDINPISGEKAFVQIATSGYHTCGLTAEGIAYCWGRDDHGQLGDGGVSTDSQSPAPVSGGILFVQLAAGSTHTCGLAPDGEAWCWGYDGSGQIGDGAGDSTSQVPVIVDTALISGDKAFVQIVAGGSLTCGLTSKGVAYCWGSDGYGQLGDGGGATTYWQPTSAVDTTPIGSEEVFIRLAAGANSACGLTSQGMLYCWGRDLNGQLGNGSTPIDDCSGDPCSQSPVTVDTNPVSGEKSFAKLECGDEHTCAVTAEGVVYCWGCDLEGRLGDGGVPSDDCGGNPCAMSPHAVDTTSITGDTAFLLVDAGGSHTCGLTSKNAAYCWGSDGSGALGDGGTGVGTQVPSPVGGCDDGLYCNGLDDCDGLGNCNVHVGDPCSSGLECNNTCDEVLDNCNDTAGTPCTDTTPDDCYISGCSGAGNCLQTYAVKSFGEACDDWVYCTGTDTCDAVGGCTNHTGNPCTGGQCNQTCNEGPQNCFDAAGASCGSSLDTDCSDPDTCDGAGACLANHASAGGLCGPLGVECQLDDTCDGSGNCLDSGPKADGTVCLSGNACAHDGTCRGGVCQEGLPRPADTLCDDGIYCNGTDTCDGLGNCVFSSGEDPCVEANVECQRTCDEDLDRCADMAGTACDDSCLTCDGNGSCDLSSSDPSLNYHGCTNPDACDGGCYWDLVNSQSVCVVEGHCDTTVCGQDFAYILDETSGQPGNCRLPQDKISLKVEVDPVTVTVGSFVPVRVYLANSWRNSYTRTDWDKDLYGLEAILRLDPGVAYVLGSAVLQGGAVPLVEEPAVDEDLVVFKLGQNPVGVESGLPGKSEWVLDLVLLCVREPSEAVFRVDVWAPCGSTPLEQVGCHDQWDSWDRDPEDIRQNQQRVSNRVQALLTGGDYSDDRVDMMRSPVFGCQCGTRAVGDEVWLFLLLPVLVSRRKSKS